MSDEHEAADSKRPEDGGLLSQLSNEMVRLQKKFWGRGPLQAKSYLMDDLLFIVMRGGLTVAEETMLDANREDSVRQFRQEFENDMTGRLTSMVEEITGRKVVTYQSVIMFDPDVVIECFVFDTSGTAQQVEATALGQLDRVAVGEAQAASGEQQ